MPQRWKPSGVREIDSWISTIDRLIGKYGDIFLSELYDGTSSRLDQMGQDGIVVNKNDTSCSGEDSIFE